MQKIISKIKNVYEKNKKFLPSRHFRMVFGVLILALILVFGISSLLKWRQSQTVINKKNKGELKVEDQTFLELLHNDTDTDGVFDWEEALWGTNKYKPATFDGVPDAKYIEEKKKELKVEGEVDEQDLTETDKFAREFFSTYTALQDSGEIDVNTIQNFAASLGQKIVSPNLADKYTQENVKLTKLDDAERAETYYITLADLYAKYEARGIGEELALISAGLESYQATSQTSSSFNELTKIGEAYQEFARDVLNTQVPQSLATYHLRIINGAYNTGISIINMAKVINDPLVGVSGVSAYEKYSGEFTSAVEDLEASFDE